MGTGFLFEGEANVLKSDSNDGCTTLDILKMTELHTLKGVGFTVCGLYFNKALTKQVLPQVHLLNMYLLRAYVLGPGNIPTHRHGPCPPRT